MKDRAMRRNMNAMREAGATVRYLQTDVRDEQAMASLIEKIHSDYGRLDGVVHGAGVIEDKLIEDKTPASFDRVFDTKADSVFILSRVLKPESLKFLVLFSSTAGAFGNRGQCDYAAANEVMNKIAVYLDRRWSTRVVAINWGPWQKRGMVSEELLRQFERRGVTLIPSPVGRRRLVEEIRYGRKGEAQPIVSGGGWEGADMGPELAVHTRLPLLEGARRPRGADGTVKVVRTLDPSQDLYLQDHQLDGRPVLPAAMAIELMVEVVQQGWPDLEVAGLRDLQVLRGVILKDEPKHVAVVALEQATPAHERAPVSVSVEITDPQTPDRLNYRAVVELTDALSKPPAFEPPFTPADLQPYPVTVAEAYDELLFHGPTFHGLVEIEGISERGMVAVCMPSSPRQCLAGDVHGQWLIDPVVFDSGLQLSILWARAHLDMTTLISRFRRYRRLGSLSDSKVRCYLDVVDRLHQHLLSINIYFVSSDGRLLGVAEEVEFPCTKDLNRLAGGRGRR
jgi:NAD(P)-dependent dehydrogenase (short-subunit alcohol dehydrogenase family)